MGIVEFGIRGAASVCFLVLAIFFFNVGTQLSSAPNNDEDKLFERYFFVVNSLRADLEDAIGTNSTSQIQAHAKELAVRAPIDPYPYEASLVLSYSEGDARAAKKFATLALARQPRSLAGHLHFFSEAAEREDYDQLLRHYEIIARLRSLNGELLADSLVGVFDGSGDWSRLLSYLDSMPPTGSTLMQRLIQIDALTSEIGELASRYPQIQPAYLERLMNEQGVEEAFWAWHSFVPSSNGGDYPIPFNGTFQSLNAPAPFNWTLHYDRADLQEGGGLYVSYPGTGNPLIARQTIKTPSGSYVLRTEAVGHMEEYGGGLEWQVSCFENSRLLGVSTIQIQRNSISETFDTDLNIPESGCEFQVLSLHARPGAFPKLMRATIVSVSLVGVPKSEH